MRHWIYLIAILLFCLACNAVQAFSVELNHRMDAFQFDPTKQRHVYLPSFGMRIQRVLDDGSAYVAASGAYGEASDFGIGRMQASYGVPVIWRNLVAGCVVGLEVIRRSIVPYAGVEINFRFPMAPSLWYISQNNSLTSRGTEHTIGIGFDFGW